ncbi:MAG TPA: SDR family oxidoreductase [Pyrinomonadaceae bacterium]
MRQVLITGGRGYLGSALLSALEAAGFSVDNCDQADGCDYRTLTADTLESYDSIIHLAAHSSVQACQADPSGAWLNNVEGFRALLSALQPGQRLIYASSASVYDRQHDAKETTNLFSARALYDVTKHNMDEFARPAGVKVYGLRFGTICGVSPVMRWEFLLNAMTRSALQTGTVTVFNSSARRSVLGILDASRAILTILRKPEAPPGIYNLASCQGTILDFGRIVAGATGARLYVSPHTTQTYDFTMNCDAFSQTFGFNFQETAREIVQRLQEYLCPS